MPLIEPPLLPEGATISLNSARAISARIFAEQKNEAYNNTYKAHCQQKMTIHKGILLEYQQAGKRKVAAQVGLFLPHKAASQKR